MQIFTIWPQGFASNTYLVTADGVHAIAIDAAQPRITQEAEARGLQIEYVLLTHGHFDHIGGCAAAQRMGAKIGCPARDRELALHNNLGPEMAGEEVEPFAVDFCYGDGDTFQLCGLEVRVLATPGHTGGSCCFLVTEGNETVLFAGDTLFRDDVGRTDLPTGDFFALKKSLSLLAKLKNCTVYPGHGMPTTLDEEKENGILPQ